MNNSEPPGDVDSRVEPGAVKLSQFDLLPPAVRRVIANADWDFALAEVVEALAGGMAPDEVARTIRDANIETTFAGYEERGIKAYHLPSFCRLTVYKDPWRRR